MDKQIYDALMDSYRLRQEQNRRIEQGRKDEVFAAHPDVEMLCLKRHSMIIGAVRSVFTASPENLEQQMLEYNKQIRELLVKYGYAPDYLAPVYECEKCEDTGLVGEVLKTECECFRKKYMAAVNRKSDSGIPSHTFENFDLNRFPDTPLNENPAVTQRRYIALLKQKCEEFANQYPDGAQKNLLLYGGSGLGKTYLMHCVMNRQTELGKEVVYVTAYQLLNDLRSNYFRPGTADTSVYENADLLLIDDLGMEPLFENVTVESIFNLFNVRTMKGLGTGISTNLTPVELKQRYTERFVSRLLDVHLCMQLPFYGQDIRLLK